MSSLGEVVGDLMKAVKYVFIGLVVIILGLLGVIAWLILK